MPKVADKQIAYERKYVKIKKLRTTKKEMFFLKAFFRELSKALHNLTFWKFKFLLIQIETN